MCAFEEILTNQSQKKNSSLLAPRLICLPAPERQPTPAPPTHLHSRWRRRHIPQTYIGIPSAVTLLYHCSTWLRTADGHDRKKGERIGKREEERPSRHCWRPHILANKRLTTNLGCYSNLLASFCVCPSRWGGLKWAWLQAAQYGRWGRL